MVMSCDVGVKKNTLRSIVRKGYSDQEYELLAWAEGIVVEVAKRLAKHKIQFDRFKDLKTYKDMRGIPVFGGKEAEEIAENMARAVHFLDKHNTWEGIKWPDVPTL